MGIQRIRTCDRCGKEFDYRGITAGYFVNGVRKSNILHFRVLFDGNPDGYSYSNTGLNCVLIAQASYWTFCLTRKDKNETLCSEI